MKKAITIQDIINGIEYITIIDGKESKPSYGAVWSTWNQNITKESEKFFGYKPEKEFDPIARENYQKYIAMACPHPVRISLPCLLLLQFWLLS